MKNNIQKKALTFVAAITKKTSAIMANQACAFWQHDPKKPTAVKKLRKF